MQRVAWQRTSALFVGLCLASFLHRVCSLAAKETKGTPQGLTSERLRGANSHAVELHPQNKTAHRVSRRLQVSETLKACSAHSDCEANDYCYSCEACHTYHNSLDPFSQQTWTCDPCDTDGGGYCVSGRFCHIAEDSITGSCPSFPGCEDHDGCKQAEYCFSCQKCRELVDSHDRGSEFARLCSPCGQPQEITGFCKSEQLCPVNLDPIGEECPEPYGCASHDDCTGETYCEGCEACMAYRETLPVDQQEYWGCFCPTQGGGFCERLRWCSIADDGIDGTCPQTLGCDSHAQCQPSQYCFSCEKCAEFHDGLPEHEAVGWTCDPCPTERAGACALREFCRVGEDSVDGACPPERGCQSHAACQAEEYCMSREACREELGPSWCGLGPNGVCHPMDECSAARSIDGTCIRPCGGHETCSPGFFCASHEECERRSPGACGAADAVLEGVCLPLSHCVQGLHSSVDGRCPVHDYLEHSRLVLQEALQVTPSSLHLATSQQGMNVWATAAGQDQLVLQLHEHNESGPGVFDDAEYLAMFTWQQGSFKEVHRERLSCPSVALAIPPQGKYVYEARIHMDSFEMSTAHPECSCVQGEQGGCPRGAEYFTSSDGAGYNVPRLYPLAFVHAQTGSYLPNHLTPYTLTVATGLIKAQLVDSSLGGGSGSPTAGCPDMGKRATDVPPLSNLSYWSRRTLPEGHVTGKWCVVYPGECSFTAKYKFCLQGGAAGVILMEHKPTGPVDLPDMAQVLVFTRTENMENMIPVVHIPYQDTFADVLTAGSEVSFAIGPDIAGISPVGFTPSEGGIRVYNATAREWLHHKTCCFKTQEWMQHSGARDVLFACTGEKKLVAIDTSNAWSTLPTIGSPRSSDLASCQASDRMRDSNVLDIHRKQTHFVTLVVDPSTVDNNIHIFLTDDLADWKYLAHMQFQNQSLGQVATTTNGDLLIVTFMCSIVYCPDAPTDLSSGRPGERIQVYNLDLVETGIPPRLLGHVDLPMSTGSLIRDIRCTMLQVCFISMTYDGVAVVDLERTSPTFLQIVAHHSETFHAAHSSEHLITRILTGAQKVLPSPTKPATVYTEGWTFSAKCMSLLQDTDDITLCMSRDKVWRMDLEGFSRMDAQAPAADPPVDARMVIAVAPETFNSLLENAAMSKEAQIIDALAKAVLVTAERFGNVQINEDTGHHTVIVTFKIFGAIEPPSVPSPAMIFLMLENQLRTAGSVLLSGPLAEVFVYGAYLEYDYEANGAQIRYVHSEGGISEWWLFLIAINVVITAIAVTVAWSYRQKANVLINAFGQQGQVRAAYKDGSAVGGVASTGVEFPFLAGPAAAVAAAGPSTASGLRMAAVSEQDAVSGAVIGRPAEAVGGQGVAGQQQQQLAFVVGRPVGQDAAAMQSSNPSKKAAAEDSSDEEKAI